MKLQELTLRTVRLPLIRPYVLSYRTFTEFEPIIVEARDTDGRIGWKAVGPSAENMPPPLSAWIRRQPRR